MKSFEFLDFSGGITDKDVPGYTNRYSVADNLLIDHDKKLWQRDGFDIYKSTAYQLAESARVARLVNFDIDSEILAFQHKNCSYISSNAWAVLQGPGGGASAQTAFNTNSTSSLVAANADTQWQHTLYAASDSGDPVVKLYRDGSSALQLRSAGLPNFGIVDTLGNDVLTPSDGGLALSIALVNDLQTKMIAHYGCNAATVGVPSSSATGHHNADSALAAQVTAVTAGTAATDLASLIALLNILRAQYNLHISDAQTEDQSSGFRSLYTFPKYRKYHASGSSSEPLYVYVDPATTTQQPWFQWRHYLNFSLTDPNNTIPSTAKIADVLGYLNDLRDKWNWHTMATNTHYNAMKWKGATTNAYYGTHKTALARVEPYTWAQITPNHGPFIQFVSDLQKEYNAHLTTDMHTLLLDDFNTIDPSFPTTPTTFWDAVCLLGGIAHCFTYHAMEADIYFTQYAFLTVSGSTTAGSKNLTLGSGGFATDFFKYMKIIPIVGYNSTPFTWSLGSDPNSGSKYAFTFGSAYNVTGSSNDSSNAVLTTPSNFRATLAGNQFLLTSLVFHYGVHDSQIFVPRDLALSWNALDFTLQTAASIQGFADLAKNIAGYLKAHTLARMTLAPVDGSSTISKINLNNYAFDVYNETNPTAAAGQNAFVHSYQDRTRFPNTIVFPQSPLIDGTVWKQTRFNAAPTAAEFNYKACFRYDFAVGSKSFTNRSAPSLPIQVIGFINEDINPDGVTESGKYAATISNLYQFANAANDNFAHTDTTNFRKEIYRTIGNSATNNYYRVDVNKVAGDCTNATTTYSDYSSDTFLVDQLELYTNDGSADNNRPPNATQLHAFGNVMYYVLGNKVYQSVPRELDSVPTDFYEEFEEDIIAVSSTRTVALAFGKSRIYRLIGGFDPYGRGGITHETIFDRTGAISAASVVKGDNGVFFAGKDGFYFTDGYQCMRITDTEKTFRTYTATAQQRNNIQGVYDNISKRIWWTLQTGNGSYPDKILVLDLQFGVRPDDTPFTTISKTSGWNPTTLAFFDGQMYYGDGDGYTWVQTRGRNLDLVKNTSVVATSWNAETIQWDFKSCHHAYGSQSVRKQFLRVTSQWDMQGTNVSAQISSDADKGRVVNQLPVIRSRKLTDWGDSKLDWISTVYPAKAGNMVDEWRYFKGDGSLRSNFRALEFANAYCVIVKSGDMGTVTIANTAGNLYSVTLTSLVATRKWPLYSVGYFVRLNGVDYPVTTRTSDSVVVVDATGLATPATGVQALWELWGHPKNERIRFLGYTVDCDDSDERQTASQGAVVTAGENVAP